jgi:PD-(D/E)XK nuclease superfamily
MIWSFSAHNMFRICQRKWYFDEMVANALAKKVPIRREAYLLSKLQGLGLWRGSLVDTVISDHIVQGISDHRTLDLEAALRVAKDLFTRQVAFARAHRLREPNLRVSEHKEEFAAWHAVEYGDGISDADLQTSWLEIENSLANLYEMPDIFRVLKAANRRISQRSLTFSIEEITIKATPDLIVFRGSQPPLIIDWKTYVSDVQDHRLQLACYGLALKSCNPHVDFPTNLSSFSITDIDLLEVQLITKRQRQYKLTDEDYSEVEAHIMESAMQIELAASASERSEIAPEKFPVAHSPMTCKYCQFRSLCWEG